MTLPPAQPDPRRAPRRRPTHRARGRLAPLSRAVRRCGVVLAARKVAGGEFLRGSVMAVLVAGSVVLNVWAARGVVPDVVGHLEVVGSFFGVALIGKSTIMALGGGKLRADRITAGEWIAHPVHSARLWRWMMTWGEPSRKAAHERYMLLLLAITVAQDTAGQDGKRIGSRPFCWRRKLPTLLRYQLATGSLPAPPPYGDPQESISGHVASQLAHLDARRSQVTPQGGTQVSEQVTSQAVSQVAGQGEGKPQGQGEARSRTDAELKPEIRRSARSFRKSNPGNDRGVITHVAGDLGIGRDRARRLLAELDASSLPSIEDRREARNAAVR